MLAFRQGDVIVREVAPVPDGEALPGLVLAYGEATGHSHKIVEGTAILVRSVTGLFLHVTSDSALLAHEEHSPVELARGYYEILLQRSYESERVLDRAD